MSVPQNIIALIFDFDDTLTDDSTTKLLEKYGIDVDKFWNEQVPEKVKNEWDPTLAYLDCLLDYVGDGKALGNLTNSDLTGFGSSLSFYQGIPEFFKSLQSCVSDHTYSNPSIEFYIISGGIEEIIKGSSVASYFNGIWGCNFEERNGKIAKVKNIISFTEKTKYLFFINKGFHERARSEQYSVNKLVEPEDRRIPFENMIYVGDGLTDVPCFSLIKKSGGEAFGVFNPNRQDSPKKAWEQLVAPKRVSTMNSPRYGKTDDLGTLIHAAVTGICLRLDTKSRAAL